MEESWVREGREEGRERENVRKANEVTSDHRGKE